MLPELPPEVWICIFDHATYVPGMLVPDIYAYATLLFGSNHTGIPLRDTLFTKLAIVRVCKQWWYLAIPFLYRSVYISIARSLYSLTRAFACRSAAKRGILVTTRPLGEYTQRLDIVMNNVSKSPPFEVNSLAALIRRMPHLAIIAFSMSGSHNVRSRFANLVLRVLQHPAPSLRVLDLSMFRPKPTPSRIVELLEKCTQLRILHCPFLVWCKELEHGGIPPTVTTLRLRELIHPDKIPLFDCTARSPGPSALQELILDVGWNVHQWRDLLHVFSSQLVSVHFYVSGLDSSFANGHLQVLAGTCPTLHRLTITTDLSSFIRPHLVFPSITYLGLRDTGSQPSSFQFELLFVFLAGLRSRVSSLQVIQLLNGHRVRYLLRAHTKMAVRVLKPFMDAKVRVEDEEGVLLTDRLKALGHL